MVWTMVSSWKTRTSFGINAAGGDAIYKIDEVPYILATMGTRVVCSGDIAITQSDNIETTYLIEQKKGKEKFNYSRLVFSDGLFVGYILVGEPAKRSINFSHCLRPVQILRL